jgi:hypothetical protein
VPEHPHDASPSQEEVTLQVGEKIKHLFIDYGNIHSESGITALSLAAGEIEYVLTAALYQLTSRLFN